MIRVLLVWLILSLLTARWFSVAVRGRDDR